MTAKEVYTNFIGPYLPLVLGGIFVYLMVLFFTNGGWENVKKAFHDTTKNKATGLYSQKRLMMWGAYLLAFFACLNDFVHLDIKPNLVFHFDKVPFETKVLLFAIALTGSAFTIAGQYWGRKQADNNGVPLTPLVTKSDLKHTEPVEECPAAKKAREEAPEISFVNPRE